MIDRKKAMFYIAEAKRSFALFTTLMGKESKANIIYLKWIDVMESLIAENEKQFFEDMAIMICKPISTIAEALNQRATELGAGNAETEISDTMKLMFINPIEAKQNLIRICNSQIFKLNAVGIKQDYLKID